MKYFYTPIYCLLFSIVILTNCARKGRPTGGPKDEKAPIMVTAKPPYESLRFNKKNIRIYFDEYIVLKGLSKQLIISPPMKYQPVITPQGTPSKYINIKILDTLTPNTTYTFNFGNAVQDNNENNKLESFKYVFSTGNYIDSLKLSGTVVDAYNQKTANNINVLLYKVDSTYNDSTVYKQKPDYVANTLDSTKFQFTNIQKGKYALIALKEQTNNYLFNSKSDQIGFYDTIIELPKDSLLKTPIKIFNEKQPFTFKRGKEVAKGKIIFGYTGEKENMKVQLLSKVPANFKSFSQFEKDKDTLNYWFTPIKIDSLNFVVSNTNFIDTTTVRLRKKKIDSLSVTASVKGVLNLKDTLFLITNNPITNIDTSKFSLVNKDTIPVQHQLKKETSNKIAVLFKKTPEMSYKLAVLPEGITDVYTVKNDSLQYTVSTKGIEDYGNIMLTINDEVNLPLRIELLAENKVVQTKYITSSQKITFELLTPQQYTIRAIVDANRNKVWDTGNFLNKTQPEKVVYFPKPIELRANWDVNETFIIK